MGGGFTHGDGFAVASGVVGSGVSGAGAVGSPGALPTGGDVGEEITSVGTESGTCSAGGGAGVGRVDVAQEATIALVAKTAALRQTLALVSIRRNFFIKGYPMFWIFLELALGLALFVFLVWWTLPKKDRDDDGPKG